MSISDVTALLSMAYLSSVMSTTRILCVAIVPPPVQTTASLFTKLLAPIHKVTRHSV